MMHKKGQAVHNVNSATRLIRKPKGQAILKKKNGEREAPSTRVGCGYTSASLVSVLSGCPYQGGFRKKSYGHKTYYFTNRKAGLTMYESPSVYGVHPFVRLTFLPSVQSVRPSVRPFSQSTQTAS